MLHDFQNLSHLPLAADVDIGQVIFVVVFLVVAFVQWLIKVIKEKAEAATRSQQMPTEEEAEARRRAWGEQTRQAEPTPAPQQQEQPTRTGGGSLGDLFGEVRKAIEEATHPKPPPPLPRPTPAPAPAPSRSRAPSPAPVVPSSSPLLATDLTSSSGASVLTMFPKRRAHPLTRLLHTPEGYQQAFILREVLGPPRAFQEFRGPED
jgi:hypothetical protein